MTKNVFISSAPLGKRQYQAGLAAWVAYMGYCLVSALGAFDNLSGQLPAEAVLAIWLAIPVLGLAGLEVYCGWLLPQRHGRAMPLAQWLVAWGRGSLTQVSLVFFAGLSTLKLSGLVGHAWGGLLAMAIWSLLLAGGQIWVALAVAAFKTAHDTDRGIPLAWLDTGEASFSGGISGLPGQESLAMPARWKRLLPENQFRFELIRRHAAIKLATHARGVLLALVWNLAGFTLIVLTLGCDLSTAKGLVSAAGIFALVQSAGVLLLLRSAARRATAETDLWAFTQGQDADIQRAAFGATARLHDEFTPGAAPLFQLRSSDADRQRYLREQKSRRGAWNAAGYALFFAWAGLSLASRFWPGRLGVPALWVFGPED